MPKLNLSDIALRTGSTYPPPHDAEMAGRSSQRLDAAGGLTQFGANLVHLDPGAKSSLRHWHEREDEFLMVTEGQLTLIEDDGETPLAPGDCAAFPANAPNGHHLVNRSAGRASFLVVGTKSAIERAHYCDIDMRADMRNGNIQFSRRDGTPLGPALAFHATSTPPQTSPLSPATVLQTYLDDAATSLINDDFSGYRDKVDLPLALHSAGTTRVISDDGDLRDIFSAYVRYIENAGITALNRTVTSAAYLSPRVVSGTYRTRFQSKTGLVGPDYLSTMTLQCSAGRWSAISAITDFQVGDWDVDDPDRVKTSTPGNVNDA